MPVEQRRRPHCPLDIHPHIARERQVLAHKHCDMSPSQPCCAHEESPLPCCPCRLSLRSSTGLFGSKTTTYDLPDAACLQAGSAFAAPRLALTARLTETPVVLSWQDGLLSPFEIQTPGTATEALRIFSEEAPPMPIFNLSPSLYPQRMSVLAAQRIQPAESELEIFEIFFLNWSESCGYALLNSGKCWRRESPLAPLEDVGAAELRFQRLDCIALTDKQRSLYRTPWGCSFRLQSRATLRQGDCDDLTPGDEKRLQSWLTHHPPGP
jgi:hypothetical protein